MSQEAVDALVKLLDLEPIEVNIFRGISPDEERQRVFGGQVAGQALVAAARTVEPGHGVHSLHAYFLRPGDPHVPILFEVDRIHDGRSFTTRRVVAIQHGKAIFNLQSSFQVPEVGLEHEARHAGGPRSRVAADFASRMAPYAEEMGPWFHRPRPIDTRHVDPSPPDRKSPLPPFQHVWLRADGVLPDNPVLHACVLARSASDMTLLDTALRPHGGSWDEHQIGHHNRPRRQETVLSLGRNLDACGSAAVLGDPPRSKCVVGFGECRPLRHADSNRLDFPLQHFPQHVPPDVRRAALLPHCPAKALRRQDGLGDEPPRR